MVKKRTGSGRIEELRRKAKTIFETKGDDIPAMSPQESRRLLHELQTYQAELEFEIEERRLAEERYRLLAENVSDVVWLADLDFECSYVSPSIEQLLGYTVEEVLALSIADVLTPRSHELALAFSREERERERTGNTAERRSLTLELEFRRKDGTTLWTEAAVTVLRKPDGTFAHTLGVIHNIQGRKDVEEELRASEKRLRKVLAATSDGMWDCDFGTGDVYYMPGSGDMLGYSTHDIRRSGVFWEELLHPEDRETALGTFREHVQGQSERYEAEFRLRNKDGDWRWILSRGEVVAWDENLKATRMVGTFTDITERKRAEERLRLLSSVVEQSTVAVGITNMAGELQFVNRAFAEMYGYAVEELQGRPISLLHPPETMEAVNAAVREMLEKGVFSGVFTSVRRDGTHFPNMMWNTVLRDAKGNVIALVGVFRDISEEKRLEEAVRQANAELQRIIGSISDCVWSADLEEDGRMTYRYCSPVVERITGIPPEVFLEGAERWLSVVHPEDRAGVLQLHEEVRTKKEGHFSAEYRIVTPDKTIRWIRDSVMATRKPEGGCRVDGIVSEAAPWNAPDSPCERSRTAPDGLV